MAKTGNTLKPVGGTLNTLKSEQDLVSVVGGKLQPQAIPLEEAVLGAILIDKDGLPAVIEVLKPQSFYLRANQIIYQTMLELFAKSRPIDLLTVNEALTKSGEIEEIGGLPYLIDLSNKVGTAANIEYHAKIIAQKYIQRELITVGTSIIKDAFEDSKDVLEMLDEAEKSLYEISDQNLNTGYEALSSLVVKAQKEIEAIGQLKSGITGVPTGFKKLDELTNGWQSSDFIIIAARPAMGKTAFVLSLAKNAAEREKPVALFSLEMSNLQLVQRLLSMQASIPSQKFRNGQLSEEEWSRLHSAVDRLSTVPIYIDDTPAINIFELRAKCRRLKQNHDISMIIIDYLQLMTGAPNAKNGSREQEISSISRALKGLAKELNVPVIALSQLSRAVETRSGDKRPQLSDLRESGAIEQDADIVTFIYRPNYYNLEDDNLDMPKDVTEIIVAKHRNGGLDTVKLKFVAENVSFQDYDDLDSDFSSDFITNPFSGNSGVVLRPSKLNTENKSPDDGFEIRNDFDF